MILTIGDPHIIGKEYDNVIQLLDSIENILKTTPNIDIIIILGDVLHNHSIIDTSSLNLALRLFKLCKQYAQTYCLVGNHDYINNSQFLNTNHWMNICKEWDDRFIIVDNPKIIVYNNIQICLTPYVYDGRLIEALDLTCNNWKQSKLIFGHQLLNGAKMGAIVADNVEEWKDEYPVMISGHIHTKQVVKDNLYYIGSSQYVGYGDLSTKYFLLISFNENEDFIFKYINVGITKKKLITINITNDNIDTIHTTLLTKSNKENTKIIFKGDILVLKQFKESSNYKEILTLYNKIVFKINPQKYITTNVKSKLFLDCLKENIADNLDLIECFNSFIKI